MSDTTPLVDDAERERISSTALDETLFVEAGAGTGKTTQLVERVVNLVLREGVPLRHLAAITFTEAAGAELRDRIRQELENVVAAHEGGPERAAAEAALADADGAAIGTLHSFALRILGEHPLDVGLPPRVEVLDEVSSQLAFEDRWRAFVDELYDDRSAEDVLLTAAMLDLPIDASAHKGSLKDVATVFSDNWDRLDGDEPDPGPLPVPAWDSLGAAVDDLEALVPGCRADDDNLFLAITERIVPQARAVLADPDPHRRLLLLRQRAPKWKGSQGRKGNWDDVEAARAAATAVGEAAEAIRLTVIDEVLERLRVRLARFTLTEAERRRREGRLEFHDLLVLARELVRTSPRARRALHDRYRRLLLDEFQDTDPIQIEVATRIAAATAAPGVDQAQEWADVEVEAGRLFFVGDPKQSIYRFRRADITLFMAARDAFADGGPVALVQNFRTVAPILDWVNHVFGALMADEVPDAQPAYRPLHAARTDVAGDHRVVVLGGERPKGTKAAELRTEEAADVARTIAAIRADPAAWPVERSRPAADEARWRPAELADITILLPTRASLGFLEDALDDLAIPYRVDTGTLVYDTQEVRDALSTLAAIDDPSDEIALVAALRSPLYACSDADLFTFVAAGGHWNVRRPVPESLPPDHPVLAALAHLRALAAERWWLEPSALLQRLFEDRQAYALGLGHRRPREVWRRLRFLVDQARQFEEAGGHGLRGFLRWAALQSEETSRVHEPLLPETDDEAVSIKTVHGAKGLEFPITVVSGLTTRPGNVRKGVTVLWEGNHPGIAFRKDTATANFDRRADYEAEMDAYERQRLLYVACTRARDHLVVCTHHAAGATCHGATLAELSADLPDDLVRRLPADLVVGVPVPEPRGTTPIEPTADDRPRWRARRAALLRRNQQTRFLSATAVAGLDRPVAPAGPDDPTGAGLPDATEDDLATDLDALLGEAADDAATAGDESGRPSFARRRGRAGTAVGRAVHATLQVVDLATGEGLDALAEQQAFAEAVPDLAGTVATLARAALASEAVRAAVGSGRLWREAYVAAPLGDRAVEGYVDLLYEAPDGLVIVDYKTDAVAGEAAVDAKLAEYRLQLATYAEALAISTGLEVSGARLVFCRSGGAVERDIADLDAARAEVRSLLGAGPT